MCGRFTQHHTPKELIQRFKVHQTSFDFGPRFNIAPRQQAAVITQDIHGQRALEGYRWGLIPSRAKDDSNAAKCINARMETLTETWSFQNAIKKRRCLVPADGFYEWKSKKNPHYIHFRDNRIYAFAGLWEEWQGQRTFTIITGPPNELLATLHHRMAMILPQDLEEAWLDPSLGAEEAIAMLKVYPADELEEFAVNSRVGNVAYDERSMIEPAEEVEKEQLELF